MDVCGDNMVVGRSWEAEREGGERKERESNDRGSCRRWINGIYTYILIFNVLVLYCIMSSILPGRERWKARGRPSQPTT